jgi:hypothetical protein
VHEVCGKTEVLVVQNQTGQPLDVYLMQGAQDATQILLGTAVVGTSEYRLPPSGNDMRWFQARIPPSGAGQGRADDPRRARDLTYKVECR